MYLTLILRNIRRSVKDYFIYFVTLTICVTLFYAFLSISSSYYHPNIDAKYNFSLLSDGMKMAIFAITFLLFFLIRYVNRYMLQQRQKEFALQAIMGMEQSTIGWLFFAELLFMGLLAVIFGIFLGMIGSQFITAMLLTSYGQPYQLSFMLFPDTVLLTIGFFLCSFWIIGLFQVRMIRKIKVFDMLYADRYNEKSIKKSNWMPIIIICYEILLCLMVVSGITKKYFYFDPRFPLPVHLMFWGNILSPALTLFFSFLWSLNRKKRTRNRLIFLLLIFSIVNACFAASVPKMRADYKLSFHSGIINEYLMYLIADLIYLICAFFYLASSFLIAWKEHSLAYQYKGQNLFFFGQLITKLNTTTKTMTLICLTFVLSIVLFVAAPALVGWASGYLEVRSLYDIQINTHYNNVYQEADLPKGDYPLVSDFLKEHHIQTAADCIFRLYLPNRADFHERVKYQFPIVAISLSDFNALRNMLGYKSITLKENEFATQWKTIATQEEQEEFFNTHTSILTDAGILYQQKNYVLYENGANSPTDTISFHSQERDLLYQTNRHSQMDSDTFYSEEAVYYNDPIGEILYNSYTNVIYIFPDQICQELLPVMRNRYIHTAETLSYHEASSLEASFVQEYPETGEGTHYYIRTSTLQINDSKAGNFLLQVSMTYGAVILMVICLTILSLQQLLDSSHFQYRFGVLWKLGVEKREMETLILKQLAVWFGLPILIAILISFVLMVYFFRMISVQITAYIGFPLLLMQVAFILIILLCLLFCYFVSTWVIFRRAVNL